MDDNVLTLMREAVIGLARDCEDVDLLDLVCKLLIVSNQNITVADSKL